MKKNLFVMAALAVLAIGCAKEQQPDVQNPADVNAKKTYLRVSVEDTKVSVNPLDGACSWQEGDVLAVWFVTEQETVIDDKGNETQKDVSGVRVEFTYESDNEDGSAKFATTENIPEFIYAKAAYPATSLTSTGGFTLTRDYTYNPDSVPVYVRDFSVTKNEDGTLSSDLVHNASVMKFTLRDIPAYAAGFVLESTTSTQTIKITTSFPYKTGYDQDITLHSVVAQGSVPTKFYLIDGENAAIEGTEKNFKEATPVNTKSYIDMGTVDFQKANLRKDYVKVCGVKWAKGNLQCIKDANDAAFQNGWRLAPAQWHHFKYNATASAEKLYKIVDNQNVYVDAKSIASPGDYRAANNGNEFEHFNYGGIARRARFYSNTNFLMPTLMEDGEDICGKMFTGTDAEISSDEPFKEINTFASANHNGLYGDLAYWATKGKFRMPNKEEMKLMIVQADKKFGCVVQDGCKIWGILFTTPVPFTPETDDNRDIGGNANTIISDSDLELGLFLPFAGRRANSSSSSIIQITKQGVYRTGTYWGKALWADSSISPNSNQSVDPYYSWALYMDTSNIGWQGHNKGAWDNGAGFCIRPVLVEE